MARPFLREVGSRAGHRRQGKPFKQAMTPFLRALNTWTPKVTSGRRELRGGSPRVPHFDRVVGALIQEESGGTGAAVARAAQSGHARGRTQMLPATAREMAGKLGLPFRPDLL